MRWKQADMCHSKVFKKVLEAELMWFSGKKKHALRRDGRWNMLPEQETGVKDFRVKEWKYI